MKKRLAPRRSERGFTLVEILIAVTLVGAIASATVTALYTSLNAHDTSRQRINESNDAQIISAFLIRDAQEAGGVDPSLGLVDPTLGVSTTDAAGCGVGSSTLAVRFRWMDRDRPSSTTFVADTWVATYSLNSDNDLIRQTCKNGAVASTLTVGRNVQSVVALCDPTSACPGMPTTVSLTITEINYPQNAPTNYQYTLAATVRPQAQSQPNGGNAAIIPLLALGTGNCADVPALAVSGGASVTVNGAAIVNSSCANALQISGNSDYDATGGTSIAGGTCLGNPPSNCNQANPLASFSPPLTDPFAGRTPPSYDCTGSGNPAQVGGRYQPGTYRSALSLGSGLQQFDAGVYVFCSGVTVSSQTQLRASQVLFYIAGGGLAINGGADVQMSATTSGTFANMLIWQAAANATGMGINGNATINNYSGIIYVPNATVTLSGTAGAIVGSIVAQRIIFTGTQDTVVGPQALAITTMTIPQAVVNAAYNTTIIRSGGVSPYVWNATGLPSGLAIDANGVISGTPTTAGGPYTVTVTVTDAVSNSASRVYSLAVNTALSISGPASLPAGVRNVAYPSTSVTASGGVTPYTWSATGLPGNMTINASSGVVSGTPTSAGTFNVVVTVTDAVGTTATRNYTVAISGPVSITAPASLPTVVRGQAYSAAVTASGGQTPYAWSASGLPTGLTINSASGVISGTTNGAAGNYNVTVTVMDGVPATANRAYTLTVSNALAITGPASLPAATQGVAYPATAGAATVVASGGATPYNWSATGLPVGLSIDATTGEVTGTPTVSGSFGVDATVTDATSATQVRSYTLTVNAPLVITGPAALPIGVINQLYPGATLNWTGGTAPFVWSAPALIPGLTISNTTGAISGTPTAAGVTNVTFTITDAAGATANITRSVDIFGISAPASLSNGVVGTSYSSTTFTAVGGAPGYTWIASGLPAGMNMSAGGALSGTPTATGTFNVTVTATDSAARSTTRNYSLVVNTQPTVTGVVLTNNNGTVARGDTVAITFSETMSVSSFCNTWSNDNNNQTISGNGVVVVTVTNNGTNDVLTVNTTSGCAFSFGSVALGGDYVSTTRTFSGNGGNASSIGWNAASRRLTITLGNPSGAVNTNVAAAVPSYTPSTSIQAATGVAMLGIAYAPSPASRF